MLNWGPYGAANEAARERNIGATSIAVGTTTDSYELTYPDRLPALADLLAIGRMPQGTRGHFVFGIAAAGIIPQRTSFGVEYRVRVRVVALDRYDRAVARLDTLIVVRHDRLLKKDEFVVGRAELELPPGRWAYRAALQVSDSLGVVLPRDSVRVATTDRRVLSISDIAMGTPGRSVPWINDRGDTVFIAPSKLFRGGADLGLYYEVTGATPGRQYRHDISVLRAGRGDPGRERPLVSLSFEEAAPGELIRSRRLVRMNQLKSGDYLVQVTVTGSDGSSQTRRRAIRLMGK
jgi:hypothetical protein